MEGLGSLGLRLVKNTPSPPQRGLELIMEDLGSSGLRLVTKTYPLSSPWTVYRVGTLMVDEKIRQ